MVVGVQAMGGDDGIALAQVLGQVHGARRGQAALLAQALQGEGDGVGVRHAAREGLAQGGVEILGAVACMQPVERGGDGAQVVAVGSGGGEELGRGGQRAQQGVGGAVLPGGVLGGGERGEVRGVLDLFAAPEAAGVHGQCAGRLGDAHVGEIGQDGQSAPDALVGDGVVVQIEAHVGSLAHGDLEALVAGEGVIGQAEQRAALGGECGAHAEGQVLGTGALGGEPEAPGAGLGKL